MIRRAAVTALLLFAMSSALRAAVAEPLAAGGSRRRAATPSGWRVPTCAQIDGVPAAAYTMNDGLSIVRPASPLTGINYVYGLVALDVPNTMLAFRNDTLVSSTDAGCSWKVVQSYAGVFPPFLTAAPGGRAYAWSPNGTFVLRHTPTEDVRLEAPVELTGLGVDPHNADHLRVSGGDGTMWDSLDGGTNWNQASSLRVPNGTPSVYRFAFDPDDIDHIVAGTAQQGAWVTRSGGKLWTKAAGISTGNANVFTFAISPADSNVVWAMGIDLANTDPDGQGRHLYRSTDGGATYTVAVSEGNGVKLINGPVMAAHPTNPNVLYFVYGSHFQSYGTDLFRYDAGSASLTLTHSDFANVDSLAFNPVDPAVIYLGLETFTN